MELRKNGIMKELRKYIDSDVFDIVLNKEEGQIVCTLKENIDKSKLKEEVDGLGNKYTVFNLLSISNLMSRIKDDSISDYKNIKYIFSSYNAFRKVVENNVVIKGDVDIALYGIWNNVNNLKVEVKNIELIDIPNSAFYAPMYVSNSLSLIASNGIVIDDSYIGADGIAGTIYLYARDIKLNDSKLFAIEGNIILYSNNLEANESYTCSNNIYFVNNTLNINDSEIKSYEKADIKSVSMQMYSSTIESNEVYLESSRISNKGNMIIARNKIVINDKSCDVIDKVTSPEITYNGQNMMINPNVVKAKTRQEFIKALKELKVESIEALRKAQDELNSSSVKKLINPRH